MAYSRNNIWISIKGENIMDSGEVVHCGIGEYHEPSTIYQKTMQSLSEDIGQAN